MTHCLEIVLWFASLAGLAWAGWQLGKMAAKRR